MSVPFGRRQGIDSNDAPWSPSREDPDEELPHAELTEEERQQAIEEIRRRPRIG
jgi:hypothetical protein